MATAAAYWSHPAEEVLQGLGTTSQSGLTTRQAAVRYRQHGPNRMAASQEETTSRLFLRQFASPLVLILIGAAFISLVLQNWLEAAIILAIVLSSALLGFFQEFRAAHAVTSLRRQLALRTRTLRNGHTVVLPVSALVPGDIIELSAGSLIPADGLVLEAKDFLVTEASLTGESFPVEKRPGIVAAEAPLVSRTNCVFLGTSVRSGTARIVVVETGSRTALGHIAARLAAPATETQFARDIRQFGYMLVRLTIVLVIFVLAANHLLARPPIDSVLFAAALAVGMSPELLPAIISVTLSTGARHMAKNGVIVRRLEAIENLGSMTVLCTDKTGTITRGALDLSGAVNPAGKESAHVRKLAFLNASFETGIENPLDAAIVAAAKRDGAALNMFQKIDEIPYDFMRKRLTIVVSDDAVCGRHWIITKGAFDQVLAVCTSIDSGGATAPLGEAERRSITEFYQRKSFEGLRVLALATKHCAAKAVYSHEDERGLSFQGFLLFSDPIKESAAAAIRDLARRGIRIKIVTGDNRYVASHVAESVGIDTKGLIIGRQIESLGDEALAAMVSGADVFAETDPQQKERVLGALQRRGHAVGYLGDGINDAAALRMADVGISVDQAVDVARESADIVLLCPDLDVLCRAVDTGRRSIANTLKYICITTSANFGNMVSMAVATPFLPFLPLAAKQILLNNFLSDLPSIAISSDNVDRERLERAPQWRLSEIRWFMIVFGLISSVFDLLTFSILLLAFHASEATFQTAWFEVSLLTELAVVLVLRTHGPAWRSAPTPLLLWLTVGVIAFALVVPFSDPFAALFGFVPLSAPILGTGILIAVAYIAVTEAAKRRFFNAIASPG